MHKRIFYKSGFFMNQSNFCIEPVFESEGTISNVKIISEFLLSPEQKVPELKLFIAFDLHH
jgi:hypothetical protein